MLFSSARWFACAFVWATVVNTALPQAPILIVDDDGGAGVDFTELRDATAAAMSGDMILVRAGSYDAEPTVAPVLIDGKSLIVVADAGAQVDVNGMIIVQNIAPSQSVTLAGLDVTMPPSPLEAREPLLVRNCTGTVLIEDCSFEALATSFLDVDGAVIDASTDVVLTGCSLFGGSLLLAQSAGGRGLCARSSSVHLYACSITGGRGTDGISAGNSAEGGPGVLLIDGFLYASGSTLTGGEGSPGGSLLFGCHDGGPGGPGLQMQGSASQTMVHDVALVGGPGGLVVGPGVCTPGAPGPSTRVGAGVLRTLLPTLPHAFDVSSNVVRSDEPFDLVFSGTPGEFAWVLTGFRPQAAFLMSFRGTLATMAPFIVSPVGFVPAGGSITVNLALPLPGLDSQNVWLQSVYLSFPPNVFTLGPPATLQVIPATL